MKSFKTLFAVLLVALSSHSFSQTLYPGNISGCIARYSFTGGTGTVLTDVSGNSNNGTMTNMTQVPGWRGSPNSAMYFNGSTSFALVPNSSNLNPQQITMIGLARFDSFYSGKCQATHLMSKGYPGFVNGVYALGISDQIYDNDCLSYDPAHYMRSDYFGPSQPITPATTPIQTGKWYFMASSYDGSTLISYQVIMDSTNMLSSITPQFSATGGSAIGTNTQDLAIGKHLNPSYPYWFTGAMDEAVIFNRVLSGQEIYRIYYYLFNGKSLNVNEAIENNHPINSLVNNGVLQINTTDGSTIGHTIIYNMEGQILIDRNLNSLSESIDLNSFPKGMLILKMLHNGKTITQKLSNL